MHVRQSVYDSYKNVKISFCSRYWVFRAWGRVGTTIGGNKLEDFRSAKAAAIENFEELFYEKTGNEWKDRKNFVKHPKKFFPIDLDLGAVRNCTALQDCRIF